MRLTGGDIASTVRMNRTTHSGSFLIVEGPTDGRFIKQFTCSSCLVIPALGKENALVATKILNEDSRGDCLTLVDTDFDFLFSCREEQPLANLIETGLHDLDMIVIMSGSVAKLLNIIGSPEKISDRLNGESSVALDVLLRAGLPIAKMRYLSIRNDYRFNFEDLNFSRFVDKRDITVDTMQMIKAVKDNSNRHDLDSNDIAEQLEMLSVSDTDLPRFCCGPDLVELLTIGLRSAWGSSQLKSNEVMQMLRVGYEASSFEASELRAEILRWEHSGTGPSILAQVA